MKTVDELKGEIIQEFGCHPLFRDLFAHLDEANNERMEQARLLGMSGERELKLRTEIELAKATIQRQKEVLEATAEGWREDHQLYERMKQWAANVMASPSFKSGFEYIRKPKPFLEKP